MQFTGFTLDPAATDQNHKCKKYYTVDQDGLAQDWNDERVFINPPYSEIEKWIHKAHWETTGGGAQTVVMLLPARTDTKWFHKFVMKSAKLTFIKGRLKFGTATAGAPFPSIIVEFNRTSNFPIIDVTDNKP